MNLQPEFYYQLIFCITTIVISFIIAKNLRSFLAKKTVSPMQKFKVILLGIYVHIEPHLFFIISLISLSIGYGINTINIDNFLIITISQMIIGLLFIGKILSRYLQKN